MNIHIFYLNYLNKNGIGMSVGGVQTYLQNLANVLQGIGHSIYIYQTSDFDFVKDENGVKVYGFKYNGNITKFGKYIYRKRKNSFNIDEDIVIFGTDILSFRIPNMKTIAIQHGISWDVPKNMGKVRNQIYSIIKFIRTFKTINRVRKVDKVICVDYNFLNWYKSIVTYPKVELDVIPNFTNIPSKNILNKFDELNDVNIIFARRFYPFRGTRIFTRVIKRLLEEYAHIHVTIAGEGPDELYMKTELSLFENVEFIKYDSSDSLKIHNDKHIAVIPTIGSEGTSLSLLEAMASECAVICTNVGGMTNIVIDEFNGLMINPTEEHLYLSLKKLINNKNLMKRLAENAYLSVENGFSFELWKNKWIKVVENIK